MITKYEKPITVNKGKTSVTFAVAVPPYKPDESLGKGYTGTAIKYEIWLKFENTWYFVTQTWKYNRLTDCVEDFKSDVYSEEQLLEKIFKYIGL